MSSVANGLVNLALTLPAGGAHHQLEDCIFTLQKLVSSTHPRFSCKASCQTFINTASIGPRKFASGI